VTGGGETGSPEGGNEALAGLMVVELGAGVAAAFCGKWLAAFGASVTRIALPGGEWMRRYHPFAPEDDRTGEAPLFDYLNTGKRTVALDLTATEGQQALRDLLAQADLLVHDEPSVLAGQLGLGEAGLRSFNPRLVEVALTPFGESGPYAGFAATPIVLLALGGYQYLTGERGRAPLMLPGFQPDYLAGLACLVGGLAGLYGRTRSGAGVQVGLTSLEVMVSLHQFTLSQYLYQGTIRSRHGNRWENLYPITLLPCRDGYLGFAITLPDQWERLCAMLGRPELRVDPRFATSLLRRQNADALDAILIDWLRDRDMLEVFRQAQEEWRLPVGPLYDLRELLEDPQYRARQYWVRPHPGSPLQPGLPVQMSETPWVRGDRGQGAGDRGQGTGTGPAGSPSGREQGTRERGQVPGFGLRGLGSDQEGIDSAASSPHTRHPMPDTRALPLCGLRVLDFTRVWAGPLCTRILADLGAEVIKIETPGAVQAATAMPGPSNSQKLNRNKLSIALDLQQEEGRALVKRLVGASDMLVENFSARVMPNFGLDYEQLRAINPGLIMLGMPGFGSSGPYRDYAAFGPAIEPMTGLTSLLGYPGGPPLASAIAYPDAVAGVTGAAALLVALVYRERSGKGQFIDLSQVEATTSLLGEYILAWQTSGELPPRLGNRHPQWAPQGTYPCRGEDQWLSLSVRSDEEWQRLCDLAGFADLSRDSEYAEASGRRRHHEQLDARIAEWTRQHDKFELMLLLQNAGVPAGAVVDARELLEDPQLRELNFYVEAQSSAGARYRMPGTPFSFDGKRRTSWDVAAGPGEHGPQLLRDLLGCAEQEIRDLTTAGVVRLGVD
jgi:crotonobetainyl-CoA:carnitine CoA-transferase CaiB-like acyl-CoA transferase